MRLVEDARCLEEAGCFSFVIECVPEIVGEILTRSVHHSHHRHWRGRALQRTGAGVPRHDGLLDHPLKPKVGEGEASEA